MEGIMGLLPRLQALLQIQGKMRKSKKDHGGKSVYPRMTSSHMEQRLQYHMVYESRSLLSKFSACAGSLAFALLTLIAVFLLQWSLSDMGWSSCAKRLLAAWSVLVAFWPFNLNFNFIPKMDVVESVCRGPHVHGCYLQIYSRTTLHTFAVNVPKLWGGRQVICREGHLQISQVRCFGSRQAQILRHSAYFIRRYD